MQNEGIFRWNYSFHFHEIDFMEIFFCVWPASVYTTNHQTDNQTGDFANMKHI
jgi:hypothetical protein